MYNTGMGHRVSLRGKSTHFMSAYIPCGCAWTIWLCLHPENKGGTTCQTIPTATNTPQCCFLSTPLHFPSPPTSEALHLN